MFDILFSIIKEQHWLVFSGSIFILLCCFEYIYNDLLGDYDDKKKIPARVFTIPILNLWICPFSWFFSMQTRIILYTTRFFYISLRIGHFKDAILTSLHAFLFIIYIKSLAIASETPKDVSGLVLYMNLFDVCDLFVTCFISAKTILKKKMPDDKLFVKFLGGFYGGVRVLFFGMDVVFSDAVIQNKTLFLKWGYFGILWIVQIALTISVFKIK